MSGEVEARILNAAKQVFIERGYGHATLDEIANVARAGKGTLYRRYPGKEAMFAAVIKQTSGQLTSVERAVSSDLPLAERLHVVGTELLERTLTPEFVGVARMVAAEAGRFPNLARYVQQEGRDQVNAMMTRVMRDHTIVDDSSERPSDFGLGAAQIFLDLTFSAMQFRAVMGEDLPSLRSEIAAKVAQAIEIIAMVSRRPTA
jgi:AcrR family transcriptional regulator